MQPEHASWNGQDRRKGARLRQLLDTIQLQMAELRAQVAAQSAQLEQLRDTLDRGRATGGAEALVRQRR